MDVANANLLKKKTMVLHGKGLRDDDLEALAEALRKSTKLGVLCLSRNEIAFADGKFAGALAGSRTVRDLYLDYNAIGPEGAHRLGAALRINKTLLKLGLDGNRIGERGCKALAGALAVNGSLREISLNRNDVGDAGARWLAASLRENRSVRAVGLRANNIGDEGARMLAGVLECNHVVEKIDLGDDAGDRAVVIIQAALDDRERKAMWPEVVPGSGDEVAAEDEATARIKERDAPRAKIQIALGNLKRKVGIVPKIVNDTVAKGVVIPGAEDAREDERMDGGITIATAPATTSRDRNFAPGGIVPRAVEATEEATRQRPRTREEMQEMFKQQRARVTRLVEV